MRVIPTDAVRRTDKILLHRQLLPSWRGPFSYNVARARFIIGLNH